MYYYLVRTEDGRQVFNGATASFEQWDNANFSSYPIQAIHPIPKIPNMALMVASLCSVVMPKEVPAGRYLVTIRMCQGMPSLLDAVYGEGVIGWGGWEEEVKESEPEKPLPRGGFF